MWPMFATGSWCAAPSVCAVAQSRSGVWSGNHRSHEGQPIRNDLAALTSLFAARVLGVAALISGVAALVSLLAAPSLPLSAQERNRAQEHDQAFSSSGPLILELPASARATALGDAFRVGGDGNLALFHHPALIAGEGFGGSRQRFGDGTHLAISGSGSWMGGALAAGVSFLEYGTSADSPLELPRTAAGLIGGGDRAAAEFTAAVGFAGELFGMGAGAAAKLVGRRLGGVSGSTVALDLGLGRRLGPVSGAVTVQNLGPGLKAGRHETPLARRVVVGAGTNGRAPVGPFDVSGAVQLARRGDGEVIPGGGLEIAWWPVQRRIFIVRIGVVRRAGEGGSSPFTYGAGFEGDRIRIDYGYRDYAHADLRSGGHHLGLAIR